MGKLMNTLRKIFEVKTKKWTTISCYSKSGISISQPLHFINGYSNGANPSMFIIIVATIHE